MIDQQTNDVPASVSDLADAAFSATAERVLIRAKQTGTDIVLWRDNRVVHVSPDECRRELEKSSKRDGS